jgi:hypothetical protein
MLTVRYSLNAKVVACRGGSSPVTVMHLVDAVMLEPLHTSVHQCAGGS